MHFEVKEERCIEKEKRERIVGDISIRHWFKPGPRHFDGLWNKP